jgi:hypothetical protein
MEIPLQTCCPLRATHRNSPTSLAKELPSYLQRSMYGVRYLLQLTSLKIHIDWQAVEQVRIRIETS